VRSGYWHELRVSLPEKATEKLYCGESSWVVTARPHGRQAKVQRSSEKWSVSNMQRNRDVK
jgi:hypothetical protein